MTWPPPPPQPPLGPTDAEREPVVVALKEHYAAGRLSLEDFESRVEAIYQARSVPELHRLPPTSAHLPPSRAAIGAATFGSCSLPA